jgi:hypothetical protein
VQPPTIRALGRRLHALERIEIVGQLLGIPSRSGAYRHSKSDDWPMVGPEASRYVIVPRLLTTLGIDYEVERNDQEDTHAAV